MSERSVKRSGKHSVTAGVAVIAAALLLGLPLLGVHVAGKPLAPFLEFPPLTRYVAHAVFSWPVFVAMAALIVACIVPFVVAAGPAPGAAGGGTPGTFPRWGFGGILLTVTAWFVAWTRVPWLAPVQAHTFLPLWLGYIVTVNAVVHARTGRCPLTHEIAFYAWLFPVSAVYWWFFEYLNRFVQNWYYVGIEAFTPVEYVFWATLAFSTVLPAVYATRELLASFPRPLSGLDRLPGLTVPRAGAVVVFIAAAAALFVIGVWPDWTFPALWLAPLALIVALQQFAGQSTIFAPLARGDWLTVWLWALAALVCGLFWETWNFLSAAKWIYSIPFVHRFEIFEMPVLGYAGYLPFGLECALAVDLAARLRPAKGR